MSIKDARILIVSENNFSSSMVKTILINIGYHDISTVDTYAELETSMVDCQPDMLIFDSSYTIDKIYELIRKTRHSDFGTNPFMTVVALCDAPTAELMQGVMTSGVDDVLVKPYSTAQFIERIKVLIETRKPFVVTSDYIGPDRRKKERVGEGEVIPLISVPNALQECFNNRMNREKFASRVNAVADEINILRLDRNGVQVSWLVERILLGFSSADGKDLDPEIKQHLKRLEQVALESGKRLVGTPFSHVISICKALSGLAEKMLNSKGKIDEKDKKLLQELSEAFRISFKEVDSDEIAKQILSETASSF